KLSSSLIGARREQGVTVTNSSFWYDCDAFVAAGGPKALSLLSFILQTARRRGRTPTSGGIEIIRGWLLRLFCDAQLLTLRQEAVACFFGQCEHCDTDKLHTNVRTVCHRLLRAICAPPKKGRRPSDLWTLFAQGISQQLTEPACFELLRFVLRIE